MRERDRYSKIGRKKKGKDGKKEGGRVRKTKKERDGWRGGDRGWRDEKRRRRRRRRRRRKREKEGETDEKLLLGCDPFVLALTKGRRERGERWQEMNRDRWRYKDRRR